MKHINKKWIALISLNAVLAGVVCVKSYTTSPRKDSHVINTQLSDIQTRLSNLQKPLEKLDFSPLNQDFNKLAVLIEELKSKDETRLNQLLAENRSELSQKLDAMHQVITEMDKKNNPIQYLPASILPFKIVSIDSIQQVSVVTVSYDFKTIPLEKTDSLAGWTVSTIDFGKQQLELVNRKKEHVLVKLGNHHA